jgi:hypothetical protein
VITRVREGVVEDGMNEPEVAAVVADELREAAPGS